MIREKYNKWSGVYEQTVENITLQSSFNNYSLTRAKYASKILEVGVGCGQASRMFISQLLKNDSVYFVSDISESMTKIYAERFNDSDISINPKIKLESLLDTEMVDINKVVSDMGEDINK